mgnify:CR=1 FL=1
MSISASKIFTRDNVEESQTSIFFYPTVVFRFPLHMLFPSHIFPISRDILNNPLAEVSSTTKYVIHDGIETSTGSESAKHKDPNSASLWTIIIPSIGLYSLGPPSLKIKDFGEM